MSKLDKTFFLRKELISLPLLLYFAAYLLYLLFNEYFNLEDEAILFKPIIVPSIAFVYFFSPDSKKSLLNLCLFTVIFLGDNVVLLKDRKLYELATFMYVIALFIIFYYVLKDSLILNRFEKINKNLSYIIGGFLVVLVLFKILNLISFLKNPEIFFVIIYIVTILSLLIVTIYTAIKKKSIAHKFLLAMIASMILSDLFFSINRYYFNNSWFVLFSCLIEVPVYYFLLRFLLEREKTIEINIK